jgi:CRP/FNR family transcriptional regulator, cyclic AMP receptor protein
VSIEDEVGVLRRVPLFAHIDPAKLKLLALTSQRLTYEPGQTVFEQGADADAAYVVLDGTADVVVDTPTGPLVLTTMERNAIMGEIGILCDVPRTATIRASARLITLRIGKAQFLDLLTKFPQISVEIMRLLASRLSHTSADLTEARTKLRELGAA